MKREQYLLENGGVILQSADQLDDEELVADYEKALEARERVCNG
ncbi:hypothetical protein [Anaerospora hongkongensis]